MSSAPPLARPRTVLFATLYQSRVRPGRGIERMAGTSTRKTWSGVDVVHRATDTP